MAIRQVHSRWPFNASGSHRPGPPRAVVREPRGSSRGFVSWGSFSALSSLTPCTAPRARTTGKRTLGHEWQDHHTRDGGLRALMRRELPLGDAVWSRGGEHELISVSQKQRADHAHARAARRAVIGAAGAGGSRALWRVNKLRSGSVACVWLALRALPSCRVQPCLRSISIHHPAIPHRRAALEHGCG